MQLGVCLLAMLFVQTSPSGGVDSKVTYSTRAARAAVVLPELGRLAGLDLRTTPQTENEILVIQVKDQPIGEILQRIATVTSGEWRHNGAVMNLFPSSKTRAAEEREELAGRIVEFKKGLKNQRKALEDQLDKIAKAEKWIAAGRPKKAKKANEDEDDPDELGPNTDPAEMQRTYSEDKLAFDLVSGLDPARLASIDEGDRVVFSTNPTAHQLPLGSNAIASINDFIQVHNSLSSIPPANVDDQLQALNSQYAAFQRDQMTKHVAKIGPVAKVLLIATDNAQSANLVFYDAAGKVTYKVEENLNGGDESDGKAVPDQPAKDSKKPTPIVFSKISLELRALIRAFELMKELPVSDELRQRIHLPAQYDPLSYFQTDELLAYAATKGKPLVADLPDQGLDDESFFGDRESADGEGAPEPNQTTVEDVETAINAGDNVKSISDPAFTLIKPAHPVVAREVRLSRIALTTLSQAAQVNGVASLDDVSTFAVQSPMLRQPSFVSEFAQVSVPSVFTTHLAIDWGALRFYGTLTAGQREAARRDHRLSVGTLNSAQRMALEAIFYSPGEQRLTVDSENKDGKPNLEELFSDIFSTIAGDYRTEPTEVAPNGLSPDSVIQFNELQEPFAMKAMPDGSARTTKTSILGLFELAASRTPSFASNAALRLGLGNVGNLRAGVMHRISFSVTVGPQTSFSRELLDLYMDKGSKVVTEKELPADFQKSIDDLAKRLATTRLGSRNVRNRGQIHP